MGSLAAVRRAVERTTWLRGLGLLVALALIAAGLPRWTVHAHAHAHAEADHGHIHATDPVDHDPQVPAPVDGHGAAVAHLHDGVPSSAMLQEVELPREAAPPPDGWLPPFQSSPRAAAAGPPPHRPPIS